MSVAADQAAGAGGDERVCHGCKQGISVVSQYIRVGSVNFHAEHFVCAVCSTNLHGKKFYSKKQRFYCQTDYEQQFCHTCRQCRQKIMNGRVIRAFGGLYHPEHFRCATCSIRLDGKYYSRDKKPYCAQHAHGSALQPHNGTSSPTTTSPAAKQYQVQPTPSTTPPAAASEAPLPAQQQAIVPTASNAVVSHHKSSSSSGERCARCHEDVRSDESVRASGKLYHSRCLSCQHCQRPLAKSGSMIFRKDDRLYCQQDYQELFSHRCTACGAPILVDCIAVNAEFYHAKCFRCATCARKLDKYLSIGGELRCSDHISASGMRVTCSVCDDVVPVHQAVAAVGCKFHPQCFRCSFCQKRLEKVSVKLRDQLICCPECLVASSVSPVLPVKDGSTARVLARRLQQAISSGFPPDPSDEAPPHSKSRRSSRSRPRSKDRSGSVTFANDTDAANIDSGGSKSDSKRGTGVDLEVEVEKASDDGGDQIPVVLARRRSRSGTSGSGSSTQQLQGQRRRSPRPPSAQRGNRHRKTNTWVSGQAGNAGGEEKNLKWKKGELIGKGSFGRVYMGMLITGELIAVKQVFLKSVEDKEIARQLESEIRLMEKLRHSNIVALLGTERLGNKFNILMEYVPGKSIDVLLDSFGPFQEETIRMYTGQLVSALEYMHTNDIIHRDIKGKNILVDTNGNLKLADFGSAKQFDNILSKEAPSISYNYTPLWTAPEVLLGNYGRKVDIWSLGCVLIEMATAKSPWSECNFDNPFRALYHIGNSNSIPKIPENLSPQAQDFIRQCLIRSPDERPDAKDLMHHEFLQDYLEDEDDEFHSENSDGGFSSDEDDDDEKASSEEDMAA